MSAERKDVEVSLKKTAERKPPRTLHPIEDMERLFDEFRSGFSLRPWRWERLPEFRMSLEARMPRLDVVDRDTEVMVRAELPGVKREDIELSLSGDLLTIKGRTKTEEKEEKGDYFRCETLQGSFARTVSLPAEVSEAGAKAALRDGILEVSLPKLEKAKKRSIAVE